MGVHYKAISATIKVAGLVYIDLADNLAVSTQRH